jgi:hypothetical protein
LFGSFLRQTSILLSRGPAALLTIFLFSFLLSGCAGYTTSSHASAPVPMIAVSAISFDFKTAPIGQTVTQTLHLSNTGGSPLNISSLAISNKEFAFTGPSLPRTVLPNTGLDYTLSFTPTTAGSASAALSILSNASTSLPAVSLAGVGQKVTASLALSATSINFGSLNLQSTSTQNVTLQNTGDFSVTISGVTLVGGGFGFSDLSPGYSLPANQKVTFQVWFKPTVAGSASGTLSILSPNLSSPVTLTMTGTASSSSSNPPPSQPAQVQHTVHLTWNPSTSTVAGYRVYRAETSGGPYSSVASSVATPSYDDSSVTSGATYYYVVTAVDTTGEESPDSNQATVTIPSP